MCMNNKALQIIFNIKKIFFNGLLSKENKEVNFSIRTGFTSNTVTSKNQNGVTVSLPEPGYGFVTRNQNRVTVSLPETRTGLRFRYQKPEPGYGFVTRNQN